MRLAIWSHKLLVKRKTECRRGRAYGKVCKSMMRIHEVEGGRREICVCVRCNFMAAP